MVYIPDGFSKAQWEAIQKKEADEKKRKGDLALLGATKFKSRSFEAWQKAGAVHLFPVDPNTATYEERPYMQRKGGDWEGSDLKKLGKTGKGQGQGSRRVDLDDLYESAAKAGKLNSASIFGGANLPWTSKQAAALNNKSKPGVTGTQAGVAGKKLTPAEVAALKKNLAKITITPKKETVPQEKKKLFGLF